MQLVYPSELKTGLFVTMGMHEPPADTLDLVLSKSGEPTRLWGRLGWAGMNIVFLTSDIMRHEARPHGQILEFVWRARSPKNGIALVNDDKLKGRLCFRIGPDSSGVMERYEIDLLGVGHAMDMYIYGQQRKAHDPETENKVLQEVTGEWEALANELRQADLDIVKQNYGSIDERALSDELLENELYAEQP